MTLKMRDYQEGSLEKLREGFASKHRVQMLYGPTGSGKTETAISLMLAAKAKGNGVAMVMDRRVLCDQTSARLAKYGIDHGVLMAGHWRYRPEETIQICTIQTLETRGGFPGLKLLIVDEAHCSRKSINDFIKNHTNVFVVGLSASPFTKGLAKIYSRVVNATTTRELVDSGMLAPLRVFIAKEIDMAGVKTNSFGEWSEADVTRKGIQITGDIVQEWVKKTYEIFGEPRKTIVFCAGVAHGEDLAKKFSEQGYNFISISYRDKDEDKQAILADFARSDTAIHGVIATDILTKGFDQPDIMIGISARPFTKSLSSHIQQMGRVMRPHAGKEAAIWLDHSGNYLRFIDEWDAIYSGGVDELDDGAEKKHKEPTPEDKEQAKCVKCGAVWPANSDICAHCGNTRERRNKVVNNPGEMVEIGASSKQAKATYTVEYKQQFYAELLGYANAHGYKEGWAFWRYREKFGMDPHKKPQPTIPTMDSIKWITSRNIAHSKSKNKRAKV